MLALVAFVVSVGLADSVNPSTVGPALYLATRRNAQRDLVGFIAGVFAVSAVGGIALTLGPGRAVLAALPRIDRRAEHIVELGAGLALIIFALVLWLQRERVARHLQRERQRRGRSPLLLGAAIMTVELPTALPYFAVVAAIAHSRRGAVTEIALLLLFNTAFVAPLVAVAIARILTGARGTRWAERAYATFEPHAAALLALVFLVVGAGLAALGAARLVHG